MPAKHTKNLVLTALFTALCCVATMVLRIPSPTGGYINPGDAAVLLGAFLLGPAGGAAAGGIGCALADLLSGYPLYAPATLVIKALMALCAGSIYRAYRGRGSTVLAGVAAECVMVGGYFLFTAVVLGLGWGAAVEVPGNCVQGLFGVACACPLHAALDRARKTR